MAQAFDLAGITHAVGAPSQMPDSVPLDMSRIYSAVRVERRIADALFREVPEDDEEEDEDEDEHGDDGEEDEDESEGYSE